MGFSLVGNSGDSKTNTTVYDTTYTASLNPQFDLEGSGAGATAIDLSPIVQGGPLSSYAPLAFSTYNPINIVSTGDNLGDTAVAALGQISGQQTASSEAAGTSSTTSSTLSSLFAGNNIYYWLAAVVFLLLSHHKG
jgi:hypothetical protein